MIQIDTLFLLNNLFWIRYQKFIEIKNPVLLCKESKNLFPNGMPILDHNRESNIGKRWQAHIIQKGKYQSQKKKENSQGNDESQVHNIII